MQNETLRPESTPSGLDDFSPRVDTARLAHAPGTLVDKYGRRVTYVRLSITDRCDFRCTYCMAEEMTFLPRHEVMSHAPSGNWMVKRPFCARSIALVSSAGVALFMRISGREKTTFG